MTGAPYITAGRPRMGHVVAVRPLGAMPDGAPVWLVAFRTDKGELIAGRTAAGAGVLSVGAEPGADRDGFGPCCIGRRAACDYVATAAGVIFTRFGWVES